LICPVIEQKNRSFGDGDHRSLAERRSGSDRGKLPMLTLHNVAMTYPNGVMALAPTSVSIPKGRFLVLLGPSGAGKSTLLRCMNGLVTPSQGDIIADNRARFSGAAARCGNIVAGRE
jgi:ABC-type sugar transport system ATPase subunit